MPEDFMPMSRHFVCKIYTIYIYRVSRFIVCGRGQFLKVIGEKPCAQFQVWALELNQSIDTGVTSTAITQTLAVFSIVQPKYYI